MMAAAESSKQRTEQTAVLRAENGACATIEGQAGQERLTVRAPDGAPLFEYRAHGQGRCVVYAPATDLELRADNGSILLCAKQDVRIEAKTVTQVAEVLRMALGVAEIHADRWLDRLGYAYREIEHLSQTRAGRIRSIARGTVQLLGKRAILKAEEDVKVKGSKIHLA